MTPDDETKTPSGVVGVERLGNTVVLTLTDDMGELNSEAIARSLQAVRDELKSAEFRNVLLDFERTDYFGSTVLGQFIQLWRDVRSRDGQMAFCGLSPHEQQILKVARLDNRWLICESRDEAIGKLGESDSKSSEPAESGD